MATTASGLLPSWRPGPARDAIVEFLVAARSVPVAERFAAFDNDGTLWCERPTYIQYDYFVDGLRRRVADQPELRDRPEYAAVLSGDPVAIGELGLIRVAVALAELFAGMSPEAFAADVATFLDTGRHPSLARRYPTVTYQPMRELLAALRQLDFTIAIVTGGGTEFVRAISSQLYGVPAELVVGTLIEYEMEADGQGRPHLLRTARLLGDANEGSAKVTNIQTQLGRRPILAAGNTVGDREMLDWAMASERPHLSLLVDHDDAEREFAYAGQAGTIADAEPLLDVAARSGWTVVSMSRDWEAVWVR